MLNKDKIEIELQMRIEYFESKLRDAKESLRYFRKTFEPYEPDQSKPAVSDRRSIMPGFLSFPNPGSSFFQLDKKDIIHMQERAAAALKSTIDGCLDHTRQMEREQKQEAKPKAKRGRPKGSGKIKKRKPGRPAGSKNKRNTIINVD